MKTQYYKELFSIDGEQSIPEVGEFVLDGEDIVGFVHKVHINAGLELNTFDVVLFEAMEVESVCVISLADEVSWADVLNMLREAVLEADEGMREEWKLFFAAENMDGRWEME